MRAFQGRRALPLAIALLLLFAACGGDDTETAVPDDTPEPDETPAPDVDDIDVDDLDSDATFVFADSAANEMLDPVRNGSGNVVQAIFPAVDRLIHQVPGTGELVPGLAESWEFVDEGLRLHLRQGVVFHDGTPFNADAVKANFERAMDHPEASSDVEAMVSPIAEVVVEDDQTVLIVRDTDPTHDINWALIEDNLMLNLGMMLSPASFDDPNLDQAPIGAGPYRVVEFRARDRIIYERFEDYWDPDAQRVARMEFIQTGDEDARLSGVRSGEIDLTFLSERQLATAEDAGLEINLKSTTQVFQVWFNYGRNVLDDVLVRQAFNHGIDREAFVETTAFGIGTPTVQVFPPGYYAYNPDYGLDHYPHDPARARELLAEAGHPEGVTIELLVLSRPQYVQFAEVLQAMLAEANITLDLQVVEPARHVIFRENDVDMIVGQRARPNPLDVLQLSFAEDAGYNPSGTRFDEIQTKIEEAARTPPGEERNELLREASGIAVELALNAPLYASERAWVSQPGCVVGLDPPVSEYHEFRGVGLSSDC